MARTGGVVACLVAIASAARAADFIDGGMDACVDFRVSVLQFGDPDYGDGLFDVSNEGWVWVNDSQESIRRLRWVSGLVLRTNVATSDNAQDHDSHDQVAHVLVDPGQEDALSNANEPNVESVEFRELSELLPATEIELEWETGTYPEEKGTSVAERFFPRWAWPNVHDRVWADGNLVFDCGHAKNRIIGENPNPLGGDPLPIYDPHYRTEIHPPRAIASMRNQARTLPGTGTTPVPVTATDLYIHGLAGAVTDVLQCGMVELVEPGDGHCRIQHPNHRGTPIEEDFYFDICLPRRPAGARLSWSSEPGPGNTVPEEFKPILEPGPAPAGCSNAAELMDGQTAVRVRVPLAGSGVTPDQVYARRIYAGWVAPPSVPLEHLSVQLKRMDLHLTEDPSVLCSNDSEISFMYTNLAAAPENEWLRLADYAPESTFFGFPTGKSVMNDYGASFGGHSYVDFAGAVWDFYIRTGRDFFITAHGYDQDCIDDHFGYHQFDRFAPQLTCKEIFAPCETLNNDSIDNLEAIFSAPDYGIDEVTQHLERILGTPNHHICFPFSDECFDVSQYELTVALDRLPLTNEDSADLNVAKTCAPDTGASFTCSIVVRNPGPGLPRNVGVEDHLSTNAPAGSFTLETPTFTSNGDPSTTTACVLTSLTTFRCAVGTVAVGGQAEITFRVTTSQPGAFDDTATASTASTDLDAANDSASAGLTIVAVDITPMEDPNPIRLDRRGLLPVAILATPEFDVRLVDPASVCFGSASSFAARTCIEAHGTAHFFDVDRDGDQDLLFHYVTQSTGIISGDSLACLSGQTFAGRTIAGCDSVLTR